MKASNRHGRDVFRQKQKKHRGARRISCIDLDSENQTLVRTLSVSRIGVGPSLAARGWPEKPRHSGWMTLHVGVCEAAFQNRTPEKSNREEIAVATVRNGAICEFSC